MKIIIHLGFVCGVLDSIFFFHNFILFFCVKSWDKPFV
jgi:hypothetical protein